MKLISITINNVPEGCTDEIIRLASVAIDRHYCKHHEVVSEETIETSNTAKDNFRVANGLKKKYYPDIELPPEPTIPE